MGCAIHGAEARSNGNKNQVGRVTDIKVDNLIIEMHLKVGFDETTWMRDGFEQSGP